MPIYVYKCDKCNIEKDVKHKMNEKPAIYCAECGSQMRKLFLPPTLKFIGEGFYTTDYKDVPLPDGTKLKHI